MRRPNFLSWLLGVLLAWAWLPSMAIQTLTFNGVVTTLSTGSITLDAPVGIVEDANWNVYVSHTDTTVSPNAGQIVKIAADGTSSALTITGLTLSTAPKELAVDASGNLYVADSGNSRIVEISPSGAATAVSTGSLVLSTPEGVAVDASGNLFIADTGNNRIVEVPAGAGTPVIYSVTVTSGSATLSSPEGLAIDGQGNLYLADTGNARVVEIPSGSGTGTALNITGTAPTIPVGVAVDSFGTLYVADSGTNQIIKVTTALVGTNFSSAVGMTNSQPAGVAVDMFGNVLVDDTGNNVVDYVEITSISFGHAALHSSTSLHRPMVIGSTNGPDLTNLTIPTFGRVGQDFNAGGYTTCSSGTSNPATCIIDVSYNPLNPGFRRGGMILTYVDNSVTPQVTRTLTVPVYAFNDSPLIAIYSGAASALSSGSVATQSPYQIAVDGTGNVYVGNATSNNVVEIPTSGSAAALSTGTFTLGHVNGVVIDGAGNRFITDSQNNLIYEVTSTNTTYQLSIDVGGSPVTLSGPTALAMDGASNLYIADTGNNRILKVAYADATLATTFPLNAIVVNTGSYSFTGGTITGLAVDASDNLYVVDSVASRIVKITPIGASSIVTFPSITLNRPEGVTVDGMGNLYVTDAGNSRIVQLSTGGTASVIPVTGVTLGGGSGHLYGVTVDASGNLYVADSSNNRVVKIPVTGGTFAFPTTNDGSTSASMTTTVMNIGDQSLTFSANPTYPSGFIANSSATNVCGSSTSLAAGATCNVSAEFAPTTPGSHSGVITLANNSQNATATQTISVNGTSVIGGDTTTTTVQISPSPTTIGQATTLTATVADTTASSTTPTGSVTFVDTIGSTNTTLNSGAAVTLSNGTATLSNVLLLGVGTHTITATYSGVSGSFLTSASTATSVAVNKGTPSITVTSSSATSDVGQSVTFTISVSSASIAPTGTVTLVSGSTQLGSSPLDSNGRASITTSALTAGMDTVTAQYSGDANYAAASGSVTETETAAGFSVTAPSDVSVRALDLATTPVTLSFQPTGGFTGTITFSCSGLPATLVCHFAPPVVVADGSNTAQTITLTITSVQQAAANSRLAIPEVTSARPASLTVQPTMACVTESRRSRNRRRAVAHSASTGRGRLRSLYASAGMVVAIGILSACSNTSHTAPVTYSVNVIATAAATGGGYTGPAVSTTLLTLTLKP